MVLQMGRPEKNRRSGVYYFREKTPVDLLSVHPKPEVDWSLRTKDPEEAKVRHAEAARKQALVWATLRKRPEPLPHAQVVALSGILYRDMMVGFGDGAGRAGHLGSGSGLVRPYRCPARWSGGAVWPRR